MATDRACKGVVAAVCRKVELSLHGVRQIQAGDLLPTTDWDLALQSVNIMVLIEILSKPVAVRVAPASLRKAS